MMKVMISFSSSLVSECTPTPLLTGVGLVKKRSTRCQPMSSALMSPLAMFARHKDETVTVLLMISKNKLVYSSNNLLITS